MSEGRDLSEWQQGHVLPSGLAEQLDLRHPTSPSQTAVMVVSHDCDIVQSKDVEPFVEVVVGRFVEDSNGNFTHAKNSRRLHLQLQGAFVELVASDKQLISKDVLLLHPPGNAERL